MFKTKDISYDFFNVLTGKPLKDDNFILSIDILDFKLLDIPYLRKVKV